ncbi:MAG: TldD/PmbA family protein [Alphaproteobacteria bacterium]|jgi:PmbA protein
MTENLKNLAQDVLSEIKKQGNFKAEVSIGKSSSLSVRSRMKKIETIESSLDKALSLRILYPQKAGYSQASCSSSDLSFKAVKSLIENTITIAKASSADPYIDLAKKSELEKKLQDLDLYDSSIPKVEELKENAIRLEEVSFKNKLITNSEGASSGYSLAESIHATSESFWGEFKSSYHSHSISLIAKKKDNMETDYAYSQGIYYKDLKSVELVAKEASDRAIAKLGAKKIDTCKLPVIFDKRVGKEIIGSFASAINGSGIARKTSFLLDFLNKPVFNNKINIIDDPKIKRGLGSRPCDAEGLPTNKLKLIDNGILTTWLLDIRSANQLKLKSNGRARGGGAGYTNLYLENGSISKNNLIKAQKKAIYITETFGMGINGITGDYSQGAFGFMIENGEITFPIHEFTIASNLKDMFLNLSTANDLEFDGAISVPTILINEMAIAGA